MTHLLALHDQMCKYEVDPASIVEDTERTRFCPQTSLENLISAAMIITNGQKDRRTDRRTDNVKPVYTPFNFIEVGV